MNDWAEVRDGGYDGHSMSNRARAAYEGGEKPLSKWTKTDILAEVKKIDSNKAELLKGASLYELKANLLKQTSWHHTSKMFNKTNFYSLDADYVEKMDSEDIARLIEGKARKTDPSKTYKGSITYLDWGGTQKHPKAVEKTLNDVNIEERGSFYIITDDDGNELLRKKMDSRGTSAISNEERDRRAEAERNERLRKETEQKNIEKNSSKEAYAMYKASDIWDKSSSGHIYERGRKPARYQYEMGLENHFEKGEKRLSPEYNSNGLINAYKIEVWDGTKFVPEET